jgi:hypothetical protein
MDESDWWGRVDAFNVLASPLKLSLVHLLSFQRVGSRRVEVFQWKRGIENAGRIYSYGFSAYRSVLRRVITDVAV